MKAKLQSALLGLVERKARVAAPVVTPLFPTLRSKTSFSSHIKPRTHFLSSSFSSYSRSAVATFVVVGGIGVAASFVWGPALHAEAPEGEEEEGGRKIRLADVRRHGRDAEEKWVTKGRRVYDITEWIPGHPGGEVILRAVGGSVDAYWNVFAIHKKKEVYEILEGYYIGDVDDRDLVDGEVPLDHVEDPFSSDPVRDERLMVLSARPCNAETPKEALGTWCTPNETFYVRNHMWVPEVDSEVHKLLIELPDGEEKEYTLDDLKRKFQEVKITATLQCSGNRRKHMTEEARSANGLQWDVGAISNAEWKGVRLRDVLADAGLDVNNPPDDAKHAQFMGVEAYGASIPIDKAVEKHGDVLIAYEMNGQTLPPDHGYPMRVVVPGTVAARSVKWVSKVVISEEESPSQWQRRDYKCFGPNVGPNQANWDEAPAIQEMPVQSAITSLRDMSSSSSADRKLLQVYGLEEDSVAVEGYAWSGGGRRIIRVDISADDGRSWHQAELLPDKALGSKAWAWTRWQWIVPRGQVGRCIVVKAVDESYNGQPAEYEPFWTFRGNLTNSWHRVGYRHMGT